MSDCESQQKHRSDSKPSSSNKRTLDDMMMKGGDHETAAAEAEDDDKTMKDKALPDMDTDDSSAAAIPSSNDCDDERNAKIENAVDNYVTNLANDLKRNNEDFTKLVTKLRNILQDDEFWNQKQELQRNGIEVITRNYFDFVVKPRDF
jgi:hypothetical protein